MSKAFKRLSHTIYECKYHIVFCPKYRFRILEGEVAGFVLKNVYQLLGYKEKVEVLEANVQPDHVHMVVSIPPKYSVSSLMGYLKGKLALRLFQRYEKLGKRYWGRHIWSRGYCVSTVGLDEEKNKAVRKMAGTKRKGDRK